MVVRVIQTTAASAARTLPWIPLNVHAPDARIQWSVNKTGDGTFTGAIEYTLDDLQVVTSALAINERTVAAASAAEMGHPATGIRLNITAASGNNQVAFRVLQMGV